MPPTPSTCSTTHPHQPSPARDVPERSIRFMISLLHTTLILPRSPTASAAIYYPPTGPSASFSPIRSPPLCRSLTNLPSYPHGPPTHCPRPSLYHPPLSYLLPWSPTATGSNPLDSSHYCLGAAVGVQSWAAVSCFRLRLIALIKCTDVHPPDIINRRANIIHRRSGACVRVDIARRVGDHSDRKADGNPDGAGAPLAGRGVDSTPVEIRGPAKTGSGTRARAGSGPDPHLQKRLARSSPCCTATRNSGYGRRAKEEEDIICVGACSGIHT